MNQIYDFTNLALKNDDAPFVLVQSSPKEDPDISDFSSKSKYEDDNWCIDLYEPVQ